MNKKQVVWAILPTYNEAENLREMALSIISLKLDLRILIVDDNSPDGTGAIADRLAAEHAPVSVIHRAGKQGLGTAYAEGFRHALERGADAVLTIDCDFSHDPKHISKFIEALESAQLVVGSRYVAGGRIENWNAYRTFLSATANRFVKMLFRMPVRDCTSGFRLYRKEAAGIFLESGLHSVGYSFQVETLFRVLRRNLKVSEIPIRFVDRAAGTSKMGLREVFFGLAQLLQLRLETFDLRFRLSQYKFNSPPQTNPKSEIQNPKSIGA
jgi:dolichol-phosphate mannosyltransferase